MKIHAKVGTHSQSVVRVGWKRKSPAIGEIIKIRSHPEKHGEPWKVVKVDMIRDVGYPLYFVSLC